MRHSIWTGIVLAAASSGTAWAQAPTPAGGEFRANVVTTGGQLYSAVAQDGSGNFVIAWASAQTVGDLVRVRLYNSAGVPLTSELAADSYTTSDKSDTSVAADAVGNFVVVWRSGNQDEIGAGVFGQRFSFAGTRRGTEFPVNAYTTGTQIYPAVASDPSGNFVVVWKDFSRDGSSDGIFGRRFNSSGVAQGGDFLVNTYTTGNQDLPAVASDAAGNFVVAWTSSAQDGSGKGVFGQRFNSAGTRVGSEFRVNSYTTGDQGTPAVAAAAGGAFVVAWESNGQDGDSYGIFAQRYDGAGVPLGGEFLVNTITTGSEKSPAVSMDASGAFIVAWQGGGGPNFEVRGRSYDSSGVPGSDEFQINTYTTGAQGRPAVALDPDGDAVVSWESFAQDGDGFGIYAQRFGDLIFQDGFETNNFSRWSSAVTESGAAAVTSAAALAGTTKGMEAFVINTNPLYVQDDTPVAEARYRARFYFNPNDFDPGEASGHHRVRICIAFDAASERVVALVLRRQGGAYAIQARVRLDDGTRADTGFFDITNAPHYLEIDWRRATAPGAGDGVFTLRIDGVLASKLMDLQNGTSAVDSVRLGAMSLKTGVGGALHFDQFESRRRVLIGPE